MGLLQNTPADARVVVLADHRVPSHRRRAAEQRQLPIGAPGAWARMAQARAGGHSAASPDAGQPSAAASPAGAVRVTHFADAAKTRGPVRRLRICGRLSDVCAELERLVAAEAHHAALARRA